MTFDRASGQQLGNVKTSSPNDLPYSQLSYLTALIKTKYLSKRLHLKQNISVTLGMVISFYLMKYTRKTCISGSHELLNGSMFIFSQMKNVYTLHSISMCTMICHRMSSIIFCDCSHIQFIYKWMMMYLLSHSSCYAIQFLILFPLLLYNVLLDAPIRTWIQFKMIIKVILHTIITISIWTRDERVCIKSN